LPADCVYFSACFAPEVCLKQAFVNDCLAGLLTPLMNCESYTGNKVLRT